MKNWKLLDDLTRKGVWDQFYRDFQFEPSHQGYSSISTEKPSIKFDLANCFEQGKDQSFFDLLDEVAISIFQLSTSIDQRMYALDWQSDCYSFSPFEEMDIDPEWNEWLIPSFPNGDYYIFLTKDFEHVWFGHPWEQSITLIGNIVDENREQIILQFKELDIPLFTRELKHHKSFFRQ